MAFVLENQVATYVCYLVLYVVEGFALIGLVVGLDERMRTSSAQAWLGAARAVGLTWAGLLLASGLVALVGQNAVVDLADSDVTLATSTWLSISIVQAALGGGIAVPRRRGSADQPGRPSHGALVLAAGSVAALLMAMAQIEPGCIANVILAALVGSELAAGASRIVTCRRRRMLAPAPKSGSGSRAPARPMEDTGGML